MTDTSLKAGVYGTPDADLVSVPQGARQCSPLIPGSADIAECPNASLDHFSIAAPAGTLERLFVMAHALRAINADGELQVVAGKNKGGQRLKAELEALGCDAVTVSSKKHHKIASVLRPADLTLIHATIKDTGPRLDDEMQIWTQPGIFSWNRPDTGTMFLVETLPALSGRGADLGSGLGLLIHAVLQSSDVKQMHMVDIDRRAIEMGYRNVADERITVHWHDMRQPLESVSALDFVVMNPPFHDAGIEDHGLGKAFIKAASKLLRKGGEAWIVANRHLPYEHELNAHFKSFEQIADQHGFKIIKAVR